MEKTLTTDKTPKLNILRSGDPKTSFGRISAAEILDQYGPPKSLSSTSLKTEKCLSVAVLARVLYFTPGVFCSHATAGCLAACLGHSSGRMQMPTHAIARDRRTALYLEAPQLFLQMLTLELTFLDRERTPAGASSCCPVERFKRPAVGRPPSRNLPAIPQHPLLRLHEKPGSNEPVSATLQLARQLPPHLLGTAQQPRTGTSSSGARRHGCRGVLARSSSDLLGMHRHRRRCSRRPVSRSRRHHRRAEGKRLRQIRPYGIRHPATAGPAVE